ncbi:hypothetical protein EYF80_041948 [Liparis tanakae]|uniref:Uncharacterized protein n=1 Tax=Liparis tanakae TaxID=230148 RepID=A0A4Z2G4Y7_9TELE|nr:hypothetical protein EYF80_041948 [Liparis tanakae]
MLMLVCVTVRHEVGQILVQTEAVQPGDQSGAAVTAQCFYLEDKGKGIVRLFLARFQSALQHYSRACYRKKKVKMKRGAGPE